ncbi:ABC transporter ATP-binding protein [Pelotomaculum propionicicum]|uniref:ABC transporter ATP-binding protein n=1 Tax=Pelotomaculum propionicicum TaxID=258475 RepID=UPI003B78F81F
MLEVNFNKKLWHFDLDLQMNVKNQILVLWGPSGSGKTTVLQCLAGLMKPSNGSIILNDKVLFSADKKISIPTRHRNIGYLFQDYALFPHMTVKQNVFYGLRDIKQKQAGYSESLLEMLESFGVGHLVDRYPRQLSGGEKQRVALARALAVLPQMLLLDEPFSALDRNIKVKLRRELKALHKKWRIPFIVVTHDEEDARYLGDTIIFLKKGKSKEVSMQKTAV